MIFQSNYKKVKIIPEMIIFIHKIHKYKKITNKVKYKVNNIYLTRNVLQVKIQIIKVTKCLSHLQNNLSNLNLEV